ncbi:unnamed protein product [Trichogramma brassicae]|uniref:DUF5641 domain-containing protein n=1 Tax=Trichogramma brassicae TaxID=86971 RepID=A0A6H5HZA8_9HYME|nr:unnamed protein product [Trichogramma brassicae]
MVGDNLFTYEEFSTLLAQIEAILNSRPLTPLPDGFEPDSVLTPAHPLIGESSIVLNEPPLKDEKLGPLERWKLVTQITQDFWERWCSEYLLTLQKRNKWLSVKRNLGPGDIVLVKDEILPCARWPLARVVEVHPGRDGLVRTVTIATAKEEEFSRKSEILRVNYWSRAVYLSKSCVRISIGLSKRDLKVLPHLLIFAPRWSSVTVCPSSYEFGSGRSARPRTSPVAVCLELRSAQRPLIALK